MEKAGDVTPLLRLLLLLPLVTYGWSIRVTGLGVPPVVVSGTNVQLKCSYEHRTDRPDPLYSIKWYRGVDQFYEYVPKKDPPVKVYPRPHLNVDKGKSDDSSVVLKKVTKETSGTFRCEVMGDKPLFETDDHARNMTVLDIPLWGPEIHGLSGSSRVRPGDVIRARCLVGPSYPDVTLSWYINYQEPPGHSSIIPSAQTDDKGRRIQISELTFKVTESSFERGAIVITCDARLPVIYHKSTNVTLVNADQPQPAGFGWFSSGSSLRSRMIVVAITTGFLLWQGL
ncbi:uncharacterized protein [Palaemon carinicauda]|uniref:uncharacterized protein n=1 Tax=Palaemon carinicauda TaxID=392227 RepID=UPI0035B579F9